MALQLLRSDAPLGRRRAVRIPAPALRRRRRATNRLVEAIRYGLARPGTESGRQARLLADIFGPQLGIELKQEPVTLRVLYDADHPPEASVE